MIKILLVSHGKLAEGIKSSLEIIMGVQEHVYTISAYVDETPFESKLEEFMETVDFNEDKLIIVSDIFGGSVNQKVMQNVDMNQIKLISGLNLPLLLELVMLSEDNVLDEKLSSIVIASKELIMYVNPIVESDIEDDFDL